MKRCTRWNDCWHDLNRIYDIYKLNDSNYQQMETNLHALLSVLKLHPPLSQDLICTQIYRVVPSTPLADTESLSGDTLVDTGESLYLDEDPTYSSLLALAYVYQDVFNPLRWLSLKAPRSFSPLIMSKVCPQIVLTWEAKRASCSLLPSKVHNASTSPICSTHGPYQKSCSSTSYYSSVISCHK